MTKEKAEEILSHLNFAEIGKYCEGCPLEEYCEEYDLFYGCEMWELSMGEDL